jgi:hypothetical protein
LINYFLETIAQSLIDAEYFDDSAYAQKLVWILGLPHFHHHEKRSVTKTASSVSLSKQGLPQGSNLFINNLNRRGSNIIFCFLVSSFLLFIDDESVISALRLNNKPSESQDMTPGERDETSSMTQSTAKVKKENLKNENIPINFL